MDDTAKFEELAQNTYTRFAKLAKAYHYAFSRTTVTKGGAPCMLFLGNHSSGKSSLINWLVGGDPVQDVGLAPTDDGFTILVYGEKDEEIRGPAAIAGLPAEYAGLANFGDSFLQHLCIKKRNRGLLKSVTLVDSPGMIDAPEKKAGRSYDFEGVVRFLAKLCDMVFFMLDPDKPGTTGETVNVFSKCLGGMEAKLLVLFNKCDTVQSLYDFARVYGNVCWNLARVLKTKDLPKIWTIYSGDERDSAAAGIPLSDFNHQRDEFRNIVERDASARRMDNVRSQTWQDFLGLSIRMRIVNRFARTLAMRKAFTLFCGAVLAPFCFFGIRLVLPGASGLGAFSAALLGGTAAVLVLAASFFVMRFVAQSTCLALSRDIDLLFKKEYKVEMTVGRHDELKQTWEGIRDETVTIVREALIGKIPWFGEFFRKRLDSARRHLEQMH